MLLCGVGLTNVSLRQSQAPTPSDTASDVALNVGDTPWVSGFSRDFSDPEGGAPDFVAASADPAVAGVQFNGGVVTVSPVATGSTRVTVTAADPAGLNADLGLVVEGAENQAPTTTIAISGVTLNVGGGPFTFDFSPDFYDPEGETLSFAATSADPAVASAQFNGSVVTVSPVAVGSTRVTVTATDPMGLEADLDFAVAVEENRAPRARGISDVTLAVDNAPRTFDVSHDFYDPEGETLLFVATSAAPGVAGVQVNGSLVTVSPVAVGSTRVTVTATDPLGLETESDFAVEVRENQAPMTSGAIPNATLAVGGVSEVFPVSYHFRDPEDGALDFAATSADPGVARVQVNWDLVTVSPVAFGSTTVTVTATDPAGLNVHSEFMVVVGWETAYSSNQGPRRTSWGIPYVTLTVGGAPRVFDVTRSFYDPEGEALDFAATSADPGVAVAQANGALVTVSPVAAGSAWVTVTATDPRRQEVDSDFIVEVLEPSGGTPVEPTNQAPMTSGTVPDVTLTVGGAPEVLDVSRRFFDVHGDTLGFAATSADPGVAGIQVSGSLVTVSPVAAGSTGGAVTATDPGSLSVSLAFDILVLASAPPVTMNPHADGAQWVYPWGYDRASGFFASPAGGLMVPPPPWRGLNIPPPLEDLPYSWTTPFVLVLPLGEGAEVVDISGGFSDPDGGALTYEATVDDTAVASAEINGGTVTVTPVAVGDTSIVVTASDPDHLTVTQSIVVVVRPVASIETSVTRVEERESFEITLSVGQPSWEGCVLLAVTEGVGEFGYHRPPEFDEIHGVGSAVSFSQWDCFLPGESTSRHWPVDVPDFDYGVELDETLTIHVVGVYARTDDGRRTAPIIGESSTLEFVIPAHGTAQATLQGPATVTEGTDALAQYTVHAYAYDDVSFTDVLGFPVTAIFNVAGLGGAVAGADFGRPSPLSAAFGRPLQRPLPPQVRVTDPRPLDWRGTSFSVPINDDGRQESEDETLQVRVTLVAPPGHPNPWGTAAGSDGNLTLTHDTAIVDDDDHGYIVSFATTEILTVYEDGVVAEGQNTSVETEIRIYPTPDEEITIPISVAERSGATSDDYSVSAGDVVFGADRATATLTVHSRSDSEADGRDSIRLSFGSLPPGVVAESPTVKIVRIVDDEPAPAGVTVGFPAASASRGEGADAPLELVATLDAADDEEVEVPLLVTYLGGASAADLAGAAPATITVAAGGASGSVLVTVEDDDIDESDAEMVRFAIDIDSLPDDVHVGTPAVFDLTIADDDTASFVVTLAPVDPAIAEDAGPTTVQVSATLRGTVARDVDTRLVIEEQDAGTHTMDRAVVTIPALMTTGIGSVVITPADDELVAGDTTVFIGGLPSPFFLAGRSAVATISDDDTANVTIIGPTGPVAEGGNVVFTVTLEGRLGTTGARVTVRTRDGTAVAGEDFAASGDSFFFSSADLVRLFTVYLADDDSFEGDETFSVEVVEIGGGLNVLDAGPVSVTIADNDAMMGAPVSGGMLPDGHVALSVEWDAPAAAGPPATGYELQYRAAGEAGYARAPHSGAATAATITALEPATEYEVRVRAINPGGPGEWSPPARLTTETGYVVGMAAESVGVNEGDPAVVSATVAPVNNTAAVLVTFEVAGDDRITPGTDYTVPANLTMTIAAGSTVASVEIATAADTDAELAEGFTVSLRSASVDGAADNRALLGDSTETAVTIAANDASVLSLSAPSLAVVGETATVTVSLSGAPAAGDVTVDVTYGGSARAANYTATASSVVIPAGTETEATIGIEVGATATVALGDVISVTIGNPDGGGAGATLTLDTSTVALTVADPNAQPGFDDGAGTVTLRVDEGVRRQPYWSPRVGVVAATDPDGDDLMFGLSGADAALFGIDPDTGTLRVASRTPLDFEERRAHTVTVSVRDGKDDIGRADMADDASVAVEIAVNDRLEPPGRLATLTVTSFPVDQGGRTRLSVSWAVPVNSASASDTSPPITGYEVQYRGSGGRYTDFVHIGTGVETVIPGLMPGTWHSVRVRAVNHEGKSEWAYRGGETEANAVPGFADAAVTLTVAESVAPGTHLGGPVTATDTDLDELTYALTGSGFGLFGVGNDGQVSLAGALDYETAEAHTLTLTAEDPFMGADTLALVVEVTDVTEAPGVPGNVAGAMAAAGGHLALSVEWDAPTNTGPEITEYDLQYRPAGGAFEDAGHTGTDTSGTIGGLAPDTKYEVRVRAVNGEGFGGWSAIVTVGTEAGHVVQVGAVNLSVDEGDTAEVEVAMVPVNAARDVVVGYTLRDERGATSPDDYAVPATQAVTIAAGETAATISVDVASDGRDEVDEVFVVSLGPPAMPGAAENRAVLGADTEASVTINAHGALVVSLLPPEDPMLAEGETAALTVTIASPVTGDALAIDLAVSGDASPSADYAVLPGTVRIPVGQSTATFEIEAAMDSVADAGETVELALTPVGEFVVDQSTVTVTIVESNGAPAFDSPPPATLTLTAAENLAAGAAIGEEPFAATDPDAGDTVAYALGDDGDSRTPFDTNRLGIDDAGQITVGAGGLDHETVARYTVVVVARDSRDGNGIADTAADAEATVVIVVGDVDEPLDAPGVPVSGGALPNGHVALSVEWDRPATVTGPRITGYDLQYRAVGGDYAAVPHSGTSTDATITGLAPGAEHEVRVRAVNPDGPGEWSAPARLTTEVGYVVDMAAESVVVNEGDPAVVSVTVAPVNATDDVLVAFSLVDDARITPGTDYTAPTSLTMTIAAGTTVASVEIATASDADAELAEGFTVSLRYAWVAGATGNRALLGDSTKTSVIIAANGASALSLSAPALAPVGGTVIATVSLSGVIPTADVTVDVTYGGGAMPADYTATVSAATITVGTARTTIGIEVGATATTALGDVISVTIDNATGGGAGATLTLDTPTVALTVADPNSRPGFTDTAETVTLMVNDGAAASVTIGAISAVDPDGDALVFALSGADMDSFTIASDGTIAVADGVTMDFEERRAHTVTASVRDNKDDIGRDDMAVDASVAVEILVIDANEPPEMMPTAVTTGGTLTAMEGAHTRARVTWTAPADEAGKPPINGYDVQYSVVPAPGVDPVYADFPHTGTEATATITGLLPETEYQVRVRARNADGASEWGGAVDLPRTEANIPPGVAAETVTLTVAENTAVGTAFGPPITVAEDDTDVLTYAVTGGGSTLFAIDADGQASVRASINFEDLETANVAATPVSLTVTVTDPFSRLDTDTTFDTFVLVVEVTDEDGEAPGIPGSLTVAVGTPENSLLVGWTAPENAGPALSYEIAHKRTADADTEWSGPITVAVTETSATITDLADETEYDVRVRAVSGEGPGDWATTETAVETGTGVDLRVLPRASGAGNALTGDDALLLFYFSRFAVLRTSENLASIVIRSLARATPVNVDTTRAHVLELVDGTPGERAIDRHDANLYKGTELNPSPFDDTDALLMFYSIRFGDVILSSDNLVRIVVQSLVRRDDLSQADMRAIIEAGRNL